MLELTKNILNTVQNIAKKYTQERLGFLLFRGKNEGFKGLKGLYNVFFKFWGINEEKGNSKF